MVGLVLEKGAAAIGDVVVAGGLRGLPAGRAHRRRLRLVLPGRGGRRRLNQGRNDYRGTYFAQKNYKSPPVPQEVIP